jgi:hypothetical protein
MMFSSAEIKGSMLKFTFEFPALEGDDSALSRNSEHKTTRDLAPYLSEQLGKNYLFEIRAV